MLTPLARPAGAAVVWAVTVQRARGRVLSGLALGVVARLVFLQAPLLFGGFIDSLRTPRAPARFPETVIGPLGSGGWLVAIALVLAASFVATALFRIVLCRAGVAVASELHDEAFQSVSRLPLAEVEDRTPGYFASRFAHDYAAVLRGLGGSFGEMVSHAIDLAILTVAIVVLNPLFAIAWLVALAALRASFRHHRRLIGAARAESAAKRPASLGRLGEAVDGSWAVRAYGAAEFFAARYAREVDDFLLARFESLALGFRASFQVGTITAALVLASSLLGTALVASGRATPGEVAAAIGVALLGSTSAQSFFELSAGMEEADVGIRRLAEVTVLGDTAPRSVVPRRRREPSGTLGLRVAGVTLSYRSVPALREVSFEIAPGRSLAIIGESGSGKSSLVHALTGLRPTESGDVVLFGAGGTERLADARRKGRLDAFRARFAVVSQEAISFRGTLREFLASPRAVDSGTLRAVLHRVGLAGRAAAVTGREIDPDLAVDFAAFSAGEMQLLGIARCLLQEDAILVFDEATSRIDQHSHERLVKLLATELQGRTRIVIAHRLETVTVCDEAIWLADGVVVARGRPRNVLDAFLLHEKLRARGQERTA